MKPAHRHQGLMGGSLARRLFSLFVAAALVPLALSSWLSSTAVADIAESLNLGSRTQATRQTSRQVLDRLMSARALLAATPIPASLSDLPAPDASPPGLGPVFRHLSLLDRDGEVVWSSAASSDLAAAWAQASSGWPEGRPQMRHHQDDASRIRLRTLTLPGSSARLLLGASHHGAARWLAEVDPAYVWAPLRDTRDDSAWQVLDPLDRSLTRFEGADFPLVAADAAPGPGGTAAAEFRATLFLGGEFDAGDWVFVQRGPRPQVRWHNLPLSMWLGLVAVGTLLAAALLSHRQIRRTLGPLEQLTEGARQFTAGASGTRVVVDRDDEIGTLAGAFNDMAAHVEAQFDALEGLAAIDQDILTGAPLQRLAERVARQLASLCPGAAASVCWLEGETTLAQVQVQVREGDPALTTQGHWTLCEHRLESFHGLARDEERSVDDPSGLADAVAEPWLSALCLAGVTRLVLLPLRRQDHTEAVLALGLPTALPAHRLQAARELRDRLAVALAAHARERELVFRAAHDSLTGLANRFGLHSRLDLLMGGADGPARTALLFIDLDHFKDVNDRHGHEAGDELLCLASSRLRACAPANACVARQGGDEFAIVLPHADEALAAAVADAAIRSLSQPFALRLGEHVLGASVGIAHGPAHGQTREALLRCADIALYAAKAAGRGQHMVFTTALDDSARERVQLQAELRAAVERSEFVAHYQPRVRPQDGVITSAEALIRWQHPRRGLVFPGAFIAQAESAGLIDAIGAWILDAACAQMATWRRQGVRVERISVNVSAHQLASGELPRQVRQALDRHALPGHALELEVTESVLVDDARIACAQLSELRGWGITIALDDFGTGYSSMAMLRKLPIDVMKVDRAFVTDLGLDDGAMAVTSAIVALARSLRLKLVAEGIETPAQAEVLRAMGCDEFQGYLFSKPVTAEQFARLPGLLTSDELPQTTGHPAQAAHS